MREQIIEIEMQLRNEADLAASARIHGNDCFRAGLKVFSRPDHAWVYRSCSLAALPAIERRFEAKLHQGDQMIERCAQANVLHLLL